MWSPPPFVTANIFWQNASENQSENIPGETHVLVPILGATCSLYEHFEFRHCVNNVHNIGFITDFQNNALPLPDGQEAKSNTGSLHHTVLRKFYSVATHSASVSMHLQIHASHVT